MYPGVQFGLALGPPGMGTATVRRTCFPSRASVPAGGACESTVPEGFELGFLRILTEKPLRNEPLLRNAKSESLHPRRAAEWLCSGSVIVNESIDCRHPRQKETR